MGDTAGVFEAMSKRLDTHLQSAAAWPEAQTDRLQLLLLTRESLGLSWRRKVTCSIDDHALITITPEQFATHRDPAIFMIPHGTPGTLQDRMTDLFAGGSCLDFSFPGSAICPTCGIIPSDYFFWDFLPWSAANAPERLFLSTSAVAHGVHGAPNGVPPNPSETLSLGAEYSLVSVVYLILGGCHYVTQFRLQGKWLKYDCTQGGSTSTSASFDHSWHSGRQVLFVYMKTSLVVVPTSGGTSSGISHGSGSGLSPAFLRALAAVRERRSN